MNPPSDDCFSGGDYPAEVKPAWNSPLLHNINPISPILAHWHQRTSPHSQNPFGVKGRASIVIELFLVSEATLQASISQLKLTVNRLQDLSGQHHTDLAFGDLVSL
jgi:hypothetical protein